MTTLSDFRLAVIGGGPAGLMAAEVARAAGLAVDVYDAKGSVGRKFLLAGKGGLNLTHSDSFADFVHRYGSRRAQVQSWLQSFGASDVRHWAGGLGVETFVGTSGRVFPTDMKAAPLLRRWVRRLRDQGVKFHMHHECVGVGHAGSLLFRTPGGERGVEANAVVLAMGGASWPELGSDGRWVSWLRDKAIEVSELVPSNCGFDVDWTEVFAERYAGTPVKSVSVSIADDASDDTHLQGEFVITRTGIEGSVIYALAAHLREAIHRQGHAEIHLDLAPNRDRERLVRELSKPRGGRSITEHLRRCVGIDGVKTGLLYEVVGKADLAEPTRLAEFIKSLPLKLVRPRPVSEAISSAGGVSFASLDEALMLKALPGVFCAGEMIDWEAPTGGYLLTACFASGRVAGHGVVDWLRRRAELAQST